jgi:predicted PurR-regulated permease PerM
MNRPAQISYVLVVIVIVTVAWLHLGVFSLAALFGYLALKMFSFHRSKPLSVALYLLVAVIVCAGLLYFASLAYHTLPKIAEASIPAMVEFAERNGIDLPFTDYATLKSTAIAQASDGIATIGIYARLASIQSVLLVAGLVVALGVFLNPSWTVDDDAIATPANMYSEVTRELGLRFENLYRSFATVMRAQILISAINTALSAIFLAVTGYPYSALLLCLVFLCGLLPIVGNLMSNAVIVGVGFTMSPKTGVLALAFLIIIHKLEYFLDSKIIGGKIHSPMWLTLIGLIVGERLMGFPGMILAPVLLYFIRLEASKHPVSIDRGEQLEICGQRDTSSNPRHHFAR